MKRGRFTEDQIIGILKEHEAGVPVAKLCRKHGVSNASLYKAVFQLAVTSQPTVAIIDAVRSTLLPHTLRLPRIGQTPRSLSH